MNIFRSWYIFLASFIFIHLRPTLRIRQFLMWPLASRVLGMEYTNTFNLKSGFRMHGYMGDHLGRHIIFYAPHLPYFWEPSTTQLVEKLSKNAHNIIVAGSHIGTTVLYARNAMTDSSGTVYTFEPISHLYERSRKNFDLNTHLGPIVIERSALGDKETDVEMTNDRLRSRIIGENENVITETEKVHVTTIDAYCRSRNMTSLDFLLLDVEGYEYNALLGMSEILKNSGPQDIIYEISHPNSDNLMAAQRIHSLLSAYGYSFYIIDDASDPVYMNSDTQTHITLIPASTQTYENYKSHRYFNVYATKRSPSDVARFCSIITE